MAKRSRSEILQGQARKSDRMASQQTNGFFPFRGFTEKELSSHVRSVETGNSAKQNILNAEKLRSKAWSYEVDKNPKLKGLQPMKGRDTPLPSSDGIIGSIENLNNKVLKLFK